MDDKIEPDAVVPSPGQPWTVTAKGPGGVLLTRPAAPGQIAVREGQALIFNGYEWLPYETRSEVEILREENLALRAEIDRLRAENQLLLSRDLDNGPSPLTGLAKVFRELDSAKVEIARLREDKC